MDKERSPARVEIVEPLRGLAALAVAWFHFTNGGPLLAEGSWLKASGLYGWLGVQVFFVISGFIIPYSLWCGGYRAGYDFGRFLLKRVVRLDPPYLVAIGVIIALMYASAATPGFAGSKPNLSAPQLLAHLGYLNAFLGYPWLNPVFWTLAIEFQHYILTALVYPAYASRNTTIRLLALMLLVGVGFWLRQGEFVFVYGGLFAFGILAFQKRVGLWNTSTYLALTTTVAVATAFQLESLTVIVGAATSLVIAFVDLQRRYSLLAFLGAVSYSLYLLHVPIGGRMVNLGARFAHSLPAEIAVLAAALTISYFAAWLLYRFIERPAQKWSSSITYRRDVKP